MKNFVKTLRLIVIVFLIFFFSCFVIEYTRLREAQKTMTMFTRIAGNYALTASQDAGSITGGNIKTAVGTKVPMYTKTEYGNYLVELGSAASIAEANGDTSLKLMTDLLQADYVRACASSPDNSLDDELNITPITFNMPYLAEAVLEAAYEEAMLKMVQNYKCKGTPGVFVNDTSMGKYRTDSGSLNCVEITATGTYNTGGISFDLRQLDDNLIRSIYGNADYYEDTMLNVFKEVAPELYSELRFAFVQSQGAGATAYTYIPTYNVTFETPWYYITSTPLLCFEDSPMLDAVGLDNLSSRIDSANNIATVNQIELAGYYDEDLMGLRDGQLMMYIDSGDASATFQYTFLG